MGNCFVKCIKRNDIPKDDEIENEVSNGSIDRFALSNTPLDTDEGQDMKEKVI
jgi:hypothetical protein